MRMFRAGEDAVQLQIDSYGELHKFTITIAGTPVPARTRAEQKLLVRLTPDAAPRDLTPSGHGALAAGNGVMFELQYVPDYDATDLPASERFAISRRLRGERPDFERVTETMSVTFPGGQVLELQTGKMDAPLNALRACVRSLHTSWGLDPAVQENLTRQASLGREDIQRAIYAMPLHMLRPNMDAVVIARMLVDATGKPTGCAVPGETLDRAFRVQLCNALSRPFEPALDADGQPVSSVAVTRIIFNKRQ